jgi:cell volume regulation protein A
LAVVISALPFKFLPKEMTFLSWAGLKGAVPITLATFPLLAGVEGSVLLFNVVFFVVLVSAVTQGWSLSTVARLLKLGQPLDSITPISVEINALRHVDGEIVEYTVGPSARLAGQLLRDLALPYGAVVTLIVRGADVIMPRGVTPFRPGDHVFIAMRTRLKPLMDRLFDTSAETPPLPSGLTLAFHADSTVGQLQRFFGIPEPIWSNEPIRSFLEASGEEQPARLGPFLVGRGEDPDLVTLTYAPEPTSDAVDPGANLPETSAQG